MEFGQRLYEICLYCYNIIFLFLVQAKGQLLFFSLIFVSFLYISFLFSFLYQYFFLWQVFTYVDNSYRLQLLKSMQFLFSFLIVIVRFLFIVSLRQTFRKDNQELTIAVRTGCEFHTIDLYYQSIEIYMRVKEGKYSLQQVIHRSTIETGEATLQKTENTTVIRAFQSFVGFCITKI